MAKEKKEDITRFIVQDRMSGEFSTDVLHRKCFDVNIRLMGTSEGYSKLVMSVVRYMRDILMREYSNYPEVKGISGANIGIPFNIIGMRIKSKPAAPPFLLIDGINGTTFMINPKIVEKSTRTKVLKSNCGSIRLEKSIKVIRPEWIRIEFHNMNLIKETHKIDGYLGFTIQHEVEHNLGILITDKEVYEDA